MNKYDILLLGGSTGSLEGINTIINRIGDDFPLPIVIITHQQKTNTSIAKTICSKTKLKINLIEDKMEIESGNIYIAQAGYQTMIYKNYFHLTKEKYIFSFAPSIDIAFSSAAKVYRERTIGVILSGMSVESDGVIGCFSIKERGGITFAQDEATSLIYGMPKKAIDAGVIDYELPPEDIINTIVQSLG